MFIGSIGLHVPINIASCFEKRVHVKKQPLHLLILDSGDMLQRLLQITKTKASFFCSSFVQDR